MSIPKEERRHKDAQLNLGSNILVARKAKELTQQKLAERAGVSRATVAQIESGGVNPRLSTLVDLAFALDVSPMMLVMDKDDLEAIAELSTADVEKLERELSEAESDQMNWLVQSGVRKNLVKAALIGSSSIGGAAAMSASAAAIGSAFLPGLGTAIGGALGAFIAKRLDKDVPSDTDGE